MTTDRDDERRATDENVADDLARLQRLESAKRAAPSGSPRHVELAEAAQHLGERLRSGTRAEAQIAREQAAERRPPRRS